MYEKPYVEAELNFSVPLIHTGSAIKNIIMNTGDHDIEVEIKGAYFRKTLTTGGDVVMQLDVEELTSIPTDGIVFSNYLKANVDRTRDDDLGVIVLKENMLNIVDGRNIFRSGGTATRLVADYNPNLQFKYLLKRNTYYRIKSSIISGDNASSESILYGLLRVVK